MIDSSTHGDFEFEDSDEDHEYLDGSILLNHQSRSPIDLASRDQLSKSYHFTSQVLLPWRLHIVP